MYFNTMNEIFAFVIGILVGVVMVVKPNFVLFRPSRRGKWIAKLIGENNWPQLIRIIGVLLVLSSGIFLFVGV